MKVLVLCTFPLIDASHGGQVRLLNMVNSLKKAGAEVKLHGVNGSSSYPQSSEYEAYPDEASFKKYIDNSFLMEDWAIGQLYEKSEAHFESLAERISITPDVIVCELPWLFGFAQKFKKEKKLKNTKIIYGSENIENELKFKILSNYMPPEHSEMCKKLIHECELRAIKEADAICCVSENDSNFCRKYTKKPVILAENGVDDAKTTVEDLIAATKISGCQKYILYCASGHPPNIYGFFDMFPLGFGFLPPDVKLIIAGSAGAAIMNDKNAKSLVNSKENIMVAGIVSESALRGLTQNAHAFILPITQGAGTNLKTAQALKSGAYVIATSVAMRGFERFINDKGIVVKDNIDEFAMAIQNALKLPALELSQEEIDKRKTLTWEYTLRDYVNFIINHEIQIK